MSTRIGIIAEGSIDHVLLSPLLHHIANSKAGYTWPLDPDDMADLLPIRKTGHGGVLEKVRALVKLLEVQSLGYSLFVIVLDRRTKAVQNEIRKLIGGKSQFVLGIAIEEIEAWWLGDRTNTLKWTNFTPQTIPHCRYSTADSPSRRAYAAEKDNQPKKTLHELTVLSDRLESVYGDGNAELARQFAEDHWLPNAQLNEIATQCPWGFGEFLRAMAQAFQHVKTQQGRLF